MANPPRARRPPRQRGRALILLVGVLLGGMVGAIVLLPTASANAHAYLAQTNPADGAVLSDPPRELSLAFSESVVLGATGLELVDADGRHFTPTRLRILGAGADAGTEDPVTLTADLPQLPQNAYRLSWHTLSRDDLHVTNGVIIFGIREQVTAAGQGEPKPRITESLLRWIVFTGVALAIGGLLSDRLLRRTGAPLAQHRPAGRPAGRRAGRLALLGGGLGAGAAGLLLFDQVHASGVSLTEVLSGRYGIGWSTRELGLLALALVAVHALRSGAAKPGPPESTRRRSALPTVIIAGSVLAVTIGTALVGHGGARGPTHVAADAVHVGAGAIWFGGIAVLILAGLPELRRPGGPAMLRSAFIAFGRPAAISAAALVASGVYLVSGVAGSADALLATFYGRVLLLKVALFAVALVLGMRNHRALRATTALRATPALRAPPALRATRTIVTESCVGLVILALAAVLTSSQPALEPQYIRPITASATPVLDVPAADLQQTLAIRPNQPGANVVVLEVFNTRRPAPGPIIDIQVRLRDSTGRPGPGIAAQQSADGRWTVPIDLVSAGPNELQVTVRRSGLADVTTHFRWTTQAVESTPHPVLFSNAPFAPWLQYLGLALMLGTGVITVVVLLRQRRRRGEPVGADTTSLPAPAELSDEPELAILA